MSEPGVDVDTSGPDAPLPPPSPSAQAVTRPSGGAFRGLPFDSWREAVDWWYRPVVEARTWITFGYLVAGAVLGPILFSVTLVLLVVAAALVPIGVGLLLVVPAFGVVDRLATAERRRAEWVGPPIPARERPPGGRGVRDGIRRRLLDEHRWRQVVFLLLGVVVGPVLFAAGAFGWWVAWQTMFGFDVGSVDLGGVLVAGLLLGAPPRLTLLVGRVAHSYVEWFLGPDREAELEERVEELAGQREQILDAVAGERRRIERNLHDGVQQQLVALGIDIGRAESRLADDPDAARELLAEAKGKVRASIGELRMIGRGLHPAVLSDRGLDAALSSVVAGAPIPISVDVASTHVLSDEVAETAYYVVNEAVANVLKYSKARTSSIRVVDEPGMLSAIRVEVHDDGRGGADPRRGTGIAGMRARVEGLDGAFVVDSPDGGPTVVTAVIPVGRRGGGAA